MVGREGHKGYKGLGLKLVCSPRVTRLEGGERKEFCGGGGYFASSGDFVVFFHLLGNLLDPDAHTTSPPPPPGRPLLLV